MKHKMEPHYTYQNCHFQNVWRGGF